MATTLPAAPRRRLTWTWLGLVPFFLFALLFIFLPSASLFIDSFRNAQGDFTFANIVGLFSPPIPAAYWLSISISAFTAIGGGLLGFMMAYALTVGNLPRWLRPVTLTFAGVASNFAGVPLAFAFISTMGRTGFVTVFLRNVMGLDVYAAGFNLYSFLGLSLTYMYFQFPLMLLIMVPAIEGLKREWREAAENLGASGWQYWSRVGLPILLLWGRDDATVTLDAAEEALATIPGSVLAILAGTRHIPHLEQPALAAACLAAHLAGDGGRLGRLSAPALEAGSSFGMHGPIQDISSLLNAGAAGDACASERSRSAAAETR